MRNSWTFKGQLCTARFLRRAATSAAQAFQQYQIRLYGKSRCEERFVMVFYIILHWGMKRSPTRAPTRLT